MLSKNLNELWKELHEAPTEYAIEYKAKATGVITNIGEDILIAIDNQDNFRHLIIPIKEGHYEDDISSRGLNIIYRSFKKQGKDFNFIDVVCKIPRLNDLFNVIIEEILEEFKKDNSQPYRICIKILECWRELLSKQFFRRLPENEIQGLFGELWYLRELLDYDTEALKYWQGPIGQPHDFSNNKLAFEIKTSTKKARIVVINGIEQLTPPLDGKLYLCHLKLKKVTGGGESVPNIIESLRDKGVNYNDILTKLADIGYSVTDEEFYDKNYRYQIGENRVYLVDENFPKITGHSFKNDRLPDKVIDINYSIDIMSEPPFPVDDNKLKQVFQEMCG